MEFHLPCAEKWLSMKSEKHKRNALHFTTIKYAESVSCEILKRIKLNYNKEHNNND